MKQSDFVRFYHDSEQQFKKFLYHIVSNVADLEDVMHDSYIKILESQVELPSFDDKKRMLYRIASRLVIDKWRHFKVMIKWADEFRLNWASQVTHQRHSFETDDILLGLNSKEKALLWLACVEQFSHEEIATILNLKIGSVRVLIHRIKEKIKRKGGSVVNQ